MMLVIAARSINIIVDLGFNFSITVTNVICLKRIALQSACSYRVNESTICFSKNGVSLYFLFIYKFIFCF